MSGAPDEAERERALRIRSFIAQGATITQHSGGLVAMSVDGAGGMLMATGDEMRRAIPGWPRKDEAQVIGGRG